jgi:hypothetical protein
MRVFPETRCPAAEWRRWLAGPLDAFFNSGRPGKLEEAVRYLA